MRIKVLPENIANKIAAGEVVERPASVVKELVENSLDAESTDITVEVKVGGKDLIRVIDNGMGMAYDDAILALERHATSKIQSVQDLETITTMGFRGEALPSIASISHLELITRSQDSLEGTKIRVEGGVTRDVERTGCPVGTRVSVASLFFNVPARRKFLKSTATEMNHIINCVTWTGLAWPQISLKLTHNGRTIIEVRGCDSIMDRIRLLYGRDFADNIVEFNWEFDTIKLQAFVGKPNFTRSSREHQLFFLNRRPIRSRLIGGALTAAFQSVIPKGRYPVAILFLEIDPKVIDVNVHPAKTEVRFRDERNVYREVMNGLALAMHQQEYIPEISASAPETHLTSSPEAPETRRAKVKSSVFEYLERQGRRPGSVPHSSELPPRRTEIFPRSDRIERPPIIQKSRKEAQQELRPPAESLMDIEDLQIKARLFNTYIVAETADEVLFIDQHIAEERVIYERLKRHMEEQGVPSQGLLLPVTVELSPAQVEVLDSALDILTNMGFDLEPFGGRTVVVRAVPSVMRSGDVKQVVMDILDQIATSPDKQDKLKLQEEALIMTACHSSVQAGENITDAEAANLLKELFHTGPPFLCPHGRPIIIRMKRVELEEKFQRR